MRWCFIGLVFAASLVCAQEEPPKIVWSCKAPYGAENVLWLVEWGPQSYVKVFDERIQAKYSMQGLEKRWDWGLGADSAYDYAVVLNASGRASYYDFSISNDGTAEARAVYKCVR